jgi:hypothetical protein
MKQESQKGGNDDFLREISLLVRSRYGLIWLKTVDQDRIESFLRYLADALGLPLFIWSSSTGLRRSGLEDPIYGTADPKTALGQVQASKMPALYCFHGLGQFLQDKVLGSKLLDVVRLMTKSESALVLTGTDLAIPEAVRPHSAVVTIPSPGPDEFRELLQSIYRDLRQRMDIKMELSSQGMSVLLKNLQGLTLMEAEKVLTKAMVEDGRLDAKDISLVIQEKKAIIERDGLLEFTPTDRSFADIADLKSLKTWLAKRKSTMADPEGAARFGLPFPKGMLLLGVPGSGKSLCAKAVAMEWGLPLLRMDPSRLYNKYIGESEKNYRRAMETAEKMAPVVLWIDEIEKAFPAGDYDDSGVSQRVLGSFLTWLQERQGDVFVAATANDIGQLPPEFLRKGRFDEIFFVDLPDRQTRSEIFRIHIKRRGRDPAGFDLDQLAEATSGFTGAEIEQVVVSALYTAFSGRACLNTELLADEVRKTRPLSRIRAEYIQALRDWAKDRTISAT